MVYVHLSDEEKLQVLLLALGLLLAALLVAVCLANAHCPLHQWLIERHLRRRRRRLTSPVELQYGEPPPGYQAALRSSRLEAPGCSLKPATFIDQQVVGGEQLQLGDYFHEPRDEQLMTSLPGHPWPLHLQVSPPPTIDSACQPAAPVMIRAWARLLDPGELVERARPPASERLDRKRSMSRQLSIPHLFGSLVGLGAPQKAHELESVGANLEPNSLVSTGSSSSNSAATPSAPVGGPIESRVLHMNVAAFSYMESALASTKKHQQLNRLQYVASAAVQHKAPVGSESSSRLCQLVVRICDIENLLSCCRSAERGCALLASRSSIHVQCDILPGRSKSARLLTYPLRALQASGGASHIVQLDGSATVAPAKGSGQPAISFASVSRPLAAFDELQPSTLADLIQFESVFVSPILHRSRVNEAHIRFRVHSQTRHLNDVCLAETKVPLRQLLRDHHEPEQQDTSGSDPQAELALSNVLANLDCATSGEPLADLLTEGRLADESRPWTLGGLQAPFEERLCWLDMATAERSRVTPHCERALLVGHWLGQLPAPAFECRPVDEAAGRVLLGLTYLPTSNRVVFHAHRASLDGDEAGARQLVKRLRLRSTTGYLLRFLMVLSGRVAKRKQSALSRKLEWDSQEPITFDLAPLGSEQPRFVVALVVRDSAGSGGPYGSLQNLRPAAGQVGGGRPAASVHSEPEPSLASEWAGGGRKHRRDLVVGHATLGDEYWRELRAQPRRQLVRQLKIH